MYKCVQRLLTFLSVLVFIKQTGGECCVLVSVAAEDDFIYDPLTEYL